VVSGVSRSSILFVTLAFVLVASSAAAWAPSAAEGSFARAPAHPAPAQGHPFVHADPRVWLPVLRETGSESQAVAAAKGDLGQSLTLYPLGDADHDGAGDYLLEARDWPQKDQDPRGTLSAHSGRDPDRVLWSLDVPPESYWYPIGDVDGDAVDDLVLDTGSEPEFEESGQGALVASYSQYRISFRGEYELLQGSTGKALFSKPSEMRFEGTDAYTGGAYLLKESFMMTSLERTGDEPATGLDYVTATGDFYDASVFAYVSPPGAYAYGGLFQSTDRLTIERLDGRGKALWTNTWDSGSQRLGYGDNSDYTGDGVPDILLYASDSSAGVFLGSPVTHASESIPPAGQARAILLDGATGATAWETKSDYFIGEAAALPAGQLRPGKHDAFFVTIGKEAADGFTTSGSRITVLDGSSGTPLRTQRWKDEFVIAIEFADVNGDQAGEIFMMKTPGNVDEGYPDEQGTFYVARPDYSPIWTLEPVEMFPFYFYDLPADMPDLNGDRVPDFLTMKFNEDAGQASSELRALSGRDGQPLWTHAVGDAKIVGFELVDDVTGDGGVDVALTWFDRPAPSGDGPGPTSGADGPPVATSSAPSTRGPDESTNLTQYPGFLEIHRGRDFGLVWKRQIHDPASGVTAENIWTTVFSVADTNGNGFADLLYSLETPGCFYMTVEAFDGGYAQAEAVCYDEGDDPADRLSFALVLEGADGALLGQFPDVLPGSIPAVPATLGDAAPMPPAPLAIDDAPSFLPGFEVVAAGLALASVGALRRRGA
jgi:hypothetical protein